MKNKLLSSLGNVAYTDNGALSNKSTQSKVLDLFALGAAMRNRSESDIENLFAAAYKEDKELALKCGFYIGDIRGTGQGERRAFKTILKWLVNKHPEDFKNNLENIPFYTRFDNALVGIDSIAVNREILEFFKNQLEEDITNMEEGKPISLASKWMKSNNCSSQESRRIAKIFEDYLGWTPKKYRQTLSALRKHIDVVERKMCAKKWDKIDYEKVPSRAAMIYRKAFSKHDGERYGEYIQAVKSGEKKINAGVLYPYDLVDKVLKGQWDQTIEEQWKSLPDYCGENPFSALVVCDTSGSMTMGSGVKPINVALSLAIYFGERIQGPFNNHFITFSASPTLQEIRGRNLNEKCGNLCRAEWQMNTDLMAVFKMILDHGERKGIPQEEMPESILIVSDQGYDQACKSNKRTNFEQIQKKYTKAGYKRPNLVFWNVNALDNNVAVERDQQGATLVSGCSPSVFKSVMEQSSLTPYDLMLEVLNSERYSRVVV